MIWWEYRPPFLDPLSIFPFCLNHMTLGYGRHGRQVVDIPKYSCYCPACPPIRAITGRTALSIAHDWQFWWTGNGTHDLKYWSDGEWNSRPQILINMMQQSSTSVNREWWTAPIGTARKAGARETAQWLYVHTQSNRELNQKWIIERWRGCWHLMYAKKRIISIPLDSNQKASTWKIDMEEEKAGFIFLPTKSMHGIINGDRDDSMSIVMKWMKYEIWGDWKWCKRSFLEMYQPTLAGAGMYLCGNVLEARAMRKETTNIIRTTYALYLGGPDISGAIFQQIYQDRKAVHIRRSWYFHHTNHKQGIDSGNCAPIVVPMHRI